MHEWLIAEAYGQMPQLCIASGFVLASQASWIWSALEEVGLRKLLREITRAM
jgi:hypothetical protein